MKKNFLVAFISILIISTMAYATSYVIHDYDTGIMHMAQDIYLTNTNSVQTQIDSIETSLNGNYVLKSGSITQIATRNHDDLQNITGNGTVHLSASEKLNYDTAYSHSQNTTSAHGLTISDVALKSGSLSQFTTRNASDINVTATSYGRGLATTDIDLQKVSNRVNQNGTPQFITDKTKCSLLLDFKGTLADRSRAINPIGSDAANKWTDNFVNDSTSKTSATNISCTFKQFDGDEGLFGSSIALEESRTNLWCDTADKSIYTNGTFRALRNVNSTYSDAYMEFSSYLLSTSPVPTQVIKLKYLSGSDNFVAQSILPTGNPVTSSIWVKGTGTFGISIGDNVAPAITATSKWTRLYQTGTPTYGEARIFIYSGEIEVCAVQFEVGAFATSYIATAATSVTRPVSRLNYVPRINTVGSISAWMKHRVLGVNSQIMPSGFYTSEDNLANAFMIYGSNGGGWNFYNGGGANTTFSYTLPVNEWYHIAITWDGSNINLYINNAFVATNVQGANFNRFVKEYLVATGVSFLLSNYAQFNYVLSDEERSQIYNSGLEGKPIVINGAENIIPVGQSLHDTNFITFTSGWGISSTYPNKPTISKSSNVALMRGILEYSGVVNSDVTIFTLPSGHRPSLPDTYYHSFVATARDSGNPVMRIIRVYGNGDVKLMASGATITNPAISLDNVNFVNGK